MGGCLEKAVGRQKCERDRVKVVLEERLRAKERVRMLAALPDGEALERVMRCEVRFAREFARTLEQLEKAKILGELRARKGKAAAAGSKSRADLLSESRSSGFRPKS